MRLAIRIAALVLGVMAVTDIVYLFGLILGEIKSGFERRLKRKYGKKEV